MSRTYAGCVMVCATILFGAALRAGGSLPKHVSYEGPVAQSLDFVILCKANFAIVDQQSGLSGIDLRTLHSVWKALGDKRVDAGPVAAGNSAAVITDNHNAIYAVSADTGAVLWHKYHASNILASDGRYFYLPEYDLGRIAALDARTGSTAWSVEMPREWTGYFSFLRVHDGLLYTNGAVVSLRTHKFVQTWPKHGGGTAIAFPRSGETLVGDSEGNLTLYDAAFKVIKKLHVGETRVDAIAANEEGILVSLAAPDSEHRGLIESLGWGGERRWGILGLSVNDIGFNPFVIVGANALIVEPGKAEKEWRFESRNLATGKVNWAAPEGDYFMGWPVVCGNTAFLRDGDRIRGFNVSDGAPSATTPVTRRRQRWEPR